MTEDWFIACEGSRRTVIQTLGGNGEFLAVYEKKYADYGPTLAAECLKEEEGMEVAVETLRQWLLAAGLWRKCRRRRPYRQRRHRKEYFGELVQMDGSHHDFVEGRRTGRS